jgi:hypothetical protein
MLACANQISFWGSIIGIKEEWKKERWAGLSLRWATNPLPQVGLAWALYSRVQLGVSSWTGQTSKKKRKSKTST